MSLLMWNCKMLNECCNQTNGISYLFIISDVSSTPYKKGYGPGEQDWGFVNVRKGAHMFYWLFFVQNSSVANFYDRPLVIWLQGGPGSSSTSFGNFEEIGPLYLNGTERPTSWAKHVNLLFIDNPVGAGFSFVEYLDALTTRNAEIAGDMVSFLKSFYKKFPKFEETPMYIFCESYGGKMTVEIARYILMAIEDGKLRSNFKGVGLGNSWISPVDSINNWAPFLYNMGIIDDVGLQLINEGAKDVEEAVKKGHYTMATDLWGELEATIVSYTYNVDFYNILHKVKYAPLMRENRSQLVSEIPELPLSRSFDEEKLQKLMEGPVKQALGVPDFVVHSQQKGAVFRRLSGDFMRPVTHVVEDLLNNTNLDVVVFTGTLDLIVDTPGTVNWVDKLRWKGAEEWKMTDKVPLTINGYIEGYVKNVDRLYLYWVLRAGHMVPTDNPETALEILRRSTKFDEM